MKTIYLLNSQIFPDVINIPIFTIKHLHPIIDFSKYNALIFTSKNAILALASKDEAWKKIPSYAIAQKTADALLNEGSNLCFTGKTSHGNEFAKELIPLLKNKKALYLSAKKTVSNLLEILEKNSININKKIAYETTCIKESKISIKKHGIIIFSSPSCIECFFKHYTWDDSYTAVVIGKTTASFLPEKINFVISKKSSILSCLDSAKKLSKN